MLAIINFVIHKKQIQAILVGPKLDLITGDFLVQNINIIADQQFTFKVAC